MRKKIKSELKFCSSKYLDGMVKFQSHNFLQHLENSVATYNTQINLIISKHQRLKKIKLKMLLMRTRIP